jgi:hypothetical protein
MAPVLILDRPDTPAAVSTALGEALGRRWRVVADAVVRVAGEEGSVDLAVLHPRHGIALVGFVAQGEEASPEEAVAAMRAMLAELETARRFSGEIAVVPVIVPLGLAKSEAAGKKLAAIIQGIFADAPPTSAVAGWVDPVVEALSSGVKLGDAGESAAGGLPKLVVPPRDDEPPSGADESRFAPTGEAPVQVAATPDGWGRWTLWFGLSIGFTLLLLALLAGFSRGGLQW